MRGLYLEGREKEKGAKGKEEGKEGKRKEDVNMRLCIIYLHFPAPPVRRPREEREDLRKRGGEKRGGGEGKGRSHYCSMVLKIALLSPIPKPVWNGDEGKKRGLKKKRKKGKKGGGREDVLSNPLCVAEGRRSEGKKKKKRGRYNSSVPGFSSSPYLYVPRLSLSAL